MIAIKTKYVGPSNFKGSRISAVADTGEKVTIHYDSALDSFANHEMARNILAKKIGYPNLKWASVNWNGDIYHGGVNAAIAIGYLTGNDVAGLSRDDALDLISEIADAARAAIAKAVG